MGYEEDFWQLRARCNELSPKEADDMFFPSSGGKTGRAKKYCGDCPVQGLCLIEAIEFDLEGFYSGTTQADRRAMALMMTDVVRRAYDESLPPEPERKATRSRYLHVIQTPTTHAIYLDELEPPEDIFILVRT